MRSLRTLLPLILVLTAVAVLSAQERHDGKALYAKHCAQCHGADLQGGNAQSLVDGVWNHGAGTGYVRRNIKHGITHLGMPAYESTLSDGEINAITRFLIEQEKVYDPKPRPTPETIQSQEYDIRVEAVAEGLEVPWAVDFIDAKTMLVTERAGRLRVVRDGKLDARAVRGTPAVVAEGQGGLLDVAADPEVAKNGWIYLAHSHAPPGETRERPPAMTRIVRGRIRDHAWVDEQVVWEAPPETNLPTRHHYGSRIVFDEKGRLYFAIGDRGARPMAQDPAKPNGKIHRVNRDGTIPTGNPFVGKEGALPSVFSCGHRNPQGLAFHPATGGLWETEHGPMGGDEINLIRPGLNYGWPEISYGRHYDGRVLTKFERKPGMEQPVLFYRPSTAVCGLDFYRGALFPKWRNHLLVGALKYESVDLLTVEKDRVMHSETIVKGMGRVRDVACGPDGAVYVVLNRPGKVIRLTPIRERF
ncbi:MAG: PQQ-dependent sugar dehydrogenase [Planctomycetota bacterium]